MIIQYYSATGSVVKEDLSSKKIGSWHLTTTLGYLPQGSLCIDYLPHGGIYPPVNDVLSYLKKFPKSNNL